MTDAMDVLSELDPALAERVEAAIAADAATMAATGYRLPKGAENACAALVAELDDADRRAVAVWVASREYSHAEDYCRWRAREGLGTALGRRRLRWSAQDAQAFFDRYFDKLAVQALHRGSWELGFALSAVEGLDESELAGLFPALTKLRDQERLKRDNGAVVRRVQGVLERAGAAEEIALPKNFLLRRDLFGPEVIAEFADELADPRFIALLLHCSALTTVRPSQKWTKRYRELAEAVPEQSAMFPVRVLTMLLTHDGTDTRKLPDGVDTADFDYTPWPVFFLGAPVAEFVRGVVWGYAATAGTSPDAVRLLGDVAVRCSETVRYTAQQRDPKVSSASIAALGTIGGDAAVAYLRRIQTSVRHRGVQKAVAAALEDAALQAGLTPQQIVERGVPTHGLEAMDDTVLQSKNKDVKKTLQTERDRLEGLLAADLRWPAAEWSQYYVSHPLTGAHARRLVWEASSDQGQTWFAGLPMPVAASDGDSAPVPSWQLADPDGTTHLVAADDTIRLWHPIHHSVADIRTWREHLTDREFRQPFKQVFREIYLLTAAEESTGSYSNRFAAHILRANQAKALSIARGWAGLQVGHWSSGYEAEAVKEFPGTPWRARFFVALVAEADRPYGDELCSTDQVRFEQKRGRQWQQADLVDVPACVLSEAFRDVDLFVGVAGIAADPAWTDRGDAAHHAYWHRQSFGELNESAQARRDALARLLPRTKIAARVSLADRFLHVRGDLRTYKIHLGSGNILMEPDDSYLCIVGARKSTDKRLFLPFEEDGGLLSMIVSKAFLLAADTKITDTTITSQIRR